MALRCVWVLYATRGAVVDKTKEGRRRLPVPIILRASTSRKCISGAGGIRVASQERREVDHVWRWDAGGGGAERSDAGRGAGSGI
jgi:hypothetical protein